MLQQVIAIVIIIFIYSRVIAQKRKNTISSSEFILWTAFWLAAAISIIFIRTIDVFVARIGFSGKGIEILLYCSAAALFYLYIKLRLRVARIEKDITRIVRQIAITEPRIHDRIKEQPVKQAT